VVSIRFLVLNGAPDVLEYLRQMGKAYGSQGKKAAKNMTAEERSELARRQPKPRPGSVRMHAWRASVPEVRRDPRRVEAQGIRPGVRPGGCGSVGARLGLSHWQFFVVRFPTNRATSERRSVIAAWLP
jgi:hypothetical protein